MDFNNESPNNVIILKRSELKDWSVVMCIRESNVEPTVVENKIENISSRVQKPSE